MTASQDRGGFVHYPAHVEGQKVRDRGEKFRDFFTQATMFWNGLTDPERDRLVEAAHFELGKVQDKEIRNRMVHDFFNHIHEDLARRVAEGIGVPPPEAFAGSKVDRSLPEVSVVRRGRYDTVATRKVAFLIAPGFDHDQLTAAKDALVAAGAKVDIVAKSVAPAKSSDGRTMEVDKSHATTASVLYDAVFVPGGAASAEAQMRQGQAIYFIQEAFKHGKPVGGIGAGVDLVEAAALPGVDVSRGPTVAGQGVVTSRDGKGFSDAWLDALRKYRHFDRKHRMLVPA